MTKFGKLSIGVLVVVLVFVALYFAQKQPPVVMAPVDEVTENNNVMETPNSDLVSFSILPDSKVRGVLSYRGTIKGAYFFEGNILINILGMDKTVLKASNAVATTDWMTVGPVDFEGNIDFTGLTAGPAYFEIHNDNASGLPENDKSILIPIIIE